ncbi:glucose uptake inhibitor SgrT [Citrobacter sp. JGM124]|uniref:glucose uptake inhibitor SgrT n=1 Tax=Citrobacter sp. JGM124 TaxID=2799789 RepID=UPI001BAC1368|nr:glucose uptake inhibitor SgrT [Citrobacter sp. JGM124]MBS0848448.1 glucose uptake inhibitor SgrT [Citrobacter sp. JGM124]
MKRFSCAAFYREYFAATQSVCSEGLARLTVEQKLEMLENIMQWETNCQSEESHDLPTQV